jgi:hypothetical protein
VVTETLCRVTQRLRNVFDMASRGLSSRALQTVRFGGRNPEITRCVCLYTAVSVIKFLGAHVVLYQD